MDHGRTTRILLLLTCILTGLAALGLYALTAAPGLTWAHDGADGGDLISAAMTWGVPHPTGCPVYCLLGRAFAQLPLGTIARRFNLFSAVSGALSTAVVCALAWHAVREQSFGLGDAKMRPTNALVAVATALAWASGRVMWSQSIVAEVYAPHAAAMAICLALARIPTRVSVRTHWVILGACLGLACGLHMTAILALPGLVLMAPPRKPRALRRVHWVLAGMAMGLIAYAYLPLAARADPPVNWGDPSTVRGFWWVISGAPYRGYVLALPLFHLPQRLGATLALWRDQYTVLGLLFMGAGIAESWRRNRMRAVGELVLVLAYVGYAIGYDTVDSYVYLLPALCTAALWLAMGALSAARQLVGVVSAPAACWLPCLALLAIPVWNASLHYADLDLSNDDQVQRWIEATLAPVPEGAWLITGQDGHTFALSYAQLVAGLRNDICAIDGELLAYDWYRDMLKRRCPDLPALQACTDPVALIATCSGASRVFLTTERPDVAARWPVVQRAESLSEVVLPLNPSYSAR